MVKGLTNIKNKINRAATHCVLYGIKYTGFKINRLQLVILFIIYIRNIS